MKLRLVAPAALAAALAAGPLLAAGPEKKPPSLGADVVDEDPDQENATKRPPAADTRLGHVYITARTGLSLPAGSASVGTALRDLASSGPLVGGNLGLGLGRHAVVEVDGSYAFLSGPAACAQCNGRSFDVGIGLRYHLAQGFAFDPWASYGAGYRASTFHTQLAATSAIQAITYKGVDVARLAFGGDFYPLPQVGFGPYVGLDLGTNYSRPDGRGFSTYAMFQVGLRLSFDPMRSALAAPKATAKR